jgi:hypothetical protein
LKAIPNHAPIWACVAAIWLLPRAIYGPKAANGPGETTSLGRLPNDYRRRDTWERVMKKQAFILIGAVLAAAGCGRTPFPVLETQLDGLKGQPAQAVIKKLGEPNETSEIAGAKVYIWSSSDAMRAGDAIGLECTVKVFVDRNDKIARSDFNGNVAGCAPYAHRLDESYDLLRSTTPMPPTGAPPPPKPPQT